MAERLTPGAHGRTPTPLLRTLRLLCLVMGLLVGLGAWPWASPDAVAQAAVAQTSTPSATAAARDAETQRIAATLRCVVCQNQSIADSQSGLAIDLRGQIDRLLAQGRTESEIRAYMVQRYGDYILYQPTLRPATALLWFGPFALLALGLWVAWTVVGPAARRAADTPPPSDARPGHSDMVADDGQRQFARRLLHAPASSLEEAWAAPGAPSAPASGRALPSEPPP